MDTIGRQVTTFVTLFMAIALIILMYVIFEPQRRVAATTQQRQESADRGAELFAKNCVVCHGPLGRGVSGAGFPLNVPTNRAPDEDRVKFLKTTISRGRLNSTGKLPNMPAWSNQEGGALGDQQIDDLINFLGYGDWSQVPKRLVALGTPTNAIPTPPGRGTPDPARVLATPVETNDPGAAVFDNNGCNGCHKIGPEFPVGGTTGPDLSHVASKEKIPDGQPTLPVNQEGLTTWIRNPPAIEPKVVMPPFDEDTISNKDMADLVNWLLKHK